MKHHYYALALFAGLFISADLIAQDRCASYEVLKMQMAANPAFARKVKESERSFAEYKRKTGIQQRHEAPSQIIIPVVVHVVYKTDAENISDEQVESQIDVLNEDFTASNSDYGNYDAGYSSVKGDPDIQFCLDTIVRKQTRKRSFNFNDGVKKSRQGGSAAIDPMNKLNIWVCNLGNRLLGYAQFPGGPATTFGVVCHYRAFGRGESYNLFEEYDMGRTTTHELGHCFGLRHIWGDANCGNDFVDDTPLHNAANYGCPGEDHESTCTGTPLEMWMNYMDYTDDICMYFFTEDQVSRMDFFIDDDAQINSIVNSSCGGARVSGNNFITLTNTEAAERNGKAGFEVYPTVTAGNLTLGLNSDESGYAMVNIYNQSGALVMKKQLFIAEGYNTNRMDVGMLPNGYYILQLAQGNERRTRKFIVLH